MDTEKKRRGRPRKQKFFENSGMSYEGAINNALDKKLAAELDDTLAHKSEGELANCAFMEKYTVKALNECIKAEGKEPLISKKRTAGNE